jgi:hypothetical protein
MVRLLEVIGGAVGRDMPAAIVASRGIHIAAVAIKRPAQEKLFQPFSAFVVELGGIAGQVQLVAATVAGMGTKSRQDRRIMIVHAARHNAFALA